MAAEWITIHLGDLCSKVGSGATPRGGSSVYLNSGEVALIRSQNVYNDGFHRDGLVFITPKHAAQLENVAVMPGDVLLNITGDSVARCCQVDDSVLPARVNQHVSIIRAYPEKLDSRFLRYLLVSPQMQARMLSWARSGGTRNALTKGMIESLEILVPANVGEQCAIAHILGTLDDKTELNRRMNEMLEAIARAIFKSWFVDFDPVRAKAEGKRPFGIDDETAALFPDSFEDSDLGEIPRGWRIGALADIATNIRELATPSSCDSSIYIGLEHMPKKSIALSDWGDPGDMRSQKHRFSKNDILFGKLRPYFHKVGIAPADGVCSTDILVVRPIHSRWLGLALFLLSSNELIAFADSTSTGTKMPRTSWKDLAEYPIPIPPDSVADAFENLVGPMIDIVCSNIHQSRTLADIRDALVPKLLTGEIRIPADQVKKMGSGKVDAQ